ncbi:MAG: hypothetical protein GY772_15455, partial [bacterium]|nr:hypothetical protein [bacterium]
MLSWITKVDPSLAGGRPGAGADVLALELGLFAEAEIASGGAVAAAFLDVSKAYEGVDHNLLARAALASGYPPMLAFLAIQAYRGPRRVRVAGAAAPSHCRPLRGITAGCPLAVSLMGAYLLPVIKAVRGPSVSFVRGFVDDLALVGAGQASVEVATHLIGAVHRGVAALSAIGLEVNRGKFQLLGSDEVTRQVLRRAQCGEVVASARDLGSDCCFNARRLQVQRQRVEEAKRRAQRVAKLPLPRLVKQRFVRGSVLPAALYGVGAVGMSATTTDQLRAAAARALRGATGSRFARTVLLGVSGGLDPGVEAP